MEEWLDMRETAIGILEEESTNEKLILRFLVYPSFDHYFRIDLVKGGENQAWFAEILRWENIEDYQRMTNPLEKVKLQGNYAPSIKQEKKTVKAETQVRLAEIIAEFEEEKEEFEAEDKAIVLDGVGYQLKVYLKAEIRFFEWRIAPKEWVLIPKLSHELMQLAKTSFP